MTIHVNPNTADMDELFAQAPTYTKKSQVTIRVASPGEKLVTTLKDGTVETSRVLNGGEHIVTNPSGEQYAIDVNTFESRYRHVDGDVYQAVGQVRAVQNPMGEHVSIDASWGEKQYGGPRCYFAERVDKPGERYIIGENEFLETYK